MKTSESKRILLVDDNAAIHEDFCKVLAIQAVDPALDNIESAIFGKQSVVNNDQEQQFNIDSAYQGQEALEKVRQALSNGQPYALAFVDIRMPPGWNGVETIQHIWGVDPNIQMVICTAHSDFSFEEISQQLKSSDNLLILKKPFDSMEIRQTALTLTTKWELRRQVKFQMDNLQNLVKERTMDLEKSYSLLKTTLESIQEGIIAVDRDEKMVTYNKRFIEVWAISEELVKSKKSAEIFKMLSEQLEDAELFIRMMNRLLKQPENESTKEWKLKTNKVLEFYAHPQYLHNQIIGMVYSFRDVTERKHLEDQLLYQATHDALTGLPNRVFLADRIKQAIAHAKRYGLYVGVLLFDLDNFKQINDSLGHNAGDLLLQLIAKKLMAGVREADTVTRLGGDEFVVVLVSQTRTENLITLATKLLEIFSTPFLIGEHEFVVTTSIGISVYPKDGQDSETLLKNADAALYRAKESGRHTFLFYEAEFNENMLQRSVLTSALRYALEKNEFIIHYQPLVELNSNKIIGLEALLRWQHPTYGLILPQTFIPLAEETGLIIPIGTWVLKTACIQHQFWQKTRPGLRLSVNISPNQFRQKNFLEVIRSTLKETKFDPHLLELEITESLILSNVGDTIQQMKELKKLGVNLAVDDFGTGYSSLGYLKYFPFDKVKIDKSFIDEISSSKADNCIVEAIINMTNKLGLDVLAEGVETEEQIQYLQTHHGEQVQGYYYSKPLDEESCTAFLKKKDK